MSTSSATFVDPTPVWGSPGLTEAAPPSADAYAGPPAPLGDAAQLLAEFPEAAQEPGDLIQPSRGVAVWTISRAQNDPAYLDVLLTWPSRSLMGLHRALEQAAVDAGMQNEARWESHEAIIDELRGRQAAAKRKRAVGMTVGLVALAGAGYVFYRVMR